MKVLLKKLICLSLVCHGLLNEDMGFLLVFCIFQILLNSRNNNKDNYNVSAIYVIFIFLLFINVREQIVFKGK